MHEMEVDHDTPALQAMSNHTREPAGLSLGEVIQEDMRGRDTKQASMLCLISPESVVPADHPLRAVKRLIEIVLRELSVFFDEMYAKTGRPSIPPERLLKSTVLMALYTVRSERMFCEQLGYNLLFKWFLDMDMHEPAFDPTTFGKNRERLLRHDVAGHFFRSVVDQARAAGLMSSEHFSVDGTLIEAWASLKSFRPKDDDDDSDNNGWADFRGRKRSNQTHASKTDPDARLMRKSNGKEAKLSYCMSVIMENRNGLLAGVDLAQATGFSERNSALAMLDRDVPRQRRRTLGADAGYDTHDFIGACRQRRVSPHVAQNRNRRRSAIDGRTTSPSGYAVSIAVRRMIEQVFGWVKTTANFRRSRLRGLAKTTLAATLVGAAYNLMRLARLTASAT
jgi:transposase